MRFRQRLVGPLGIVLVNALLLTVLTGAATSHIQTIYLERYPLYFDSVSYQLNSAKLYTRVAQEGQLSVALDEWLHNPRYPLRTVPIVLLAPALLAHPIGHMATVIPILFAFLALFGWTVYQRSKSALYAVGATGLFCGIPGVYYATSGLGAFWLDQTAAMLAACAVFCLLNSSQGHDLRWLVGFGLFVALTALSRYIAIVYLFLVSAPIVGVYLVGRAVSERGLLRPVLLPCLVIGVPISVIAGYFLVSQFQANLEFYSQYSYALNGTIEASWAFVGQFLIALLTSPILLILLTMCMLYVAQGWRVVHNHVGEIVGSIWCASSLLVYMVIGQRVTAAIHPLWYIIPLLVVAAVVPFSLAQPTIGSSRRAIDLMGALMLGAGIALGMQTYNQQLALAHQPSEAIQKYKYVDIELGKDLSSIGYPVVWNAYFDEYTAIPSMEAFFRFGVLPLPAGQSFFNAHETAWRADYPNLSAEEISERVYAATARYVDVAVVFINPDEALVAPQLTNEFSRTVAQYISKRIREDNNWTLIRGFESSPFGSLAVYRNNTSAGAAYNAILRGDESVRP